MSFAHRPDTRQDVARIRHTNGDQSIELHSGARLLFAGRPVHARGLNADTLLIDGLLCRDGELHAVPVLAGARNPQRVQRI